MPLERTSESLSALGVRGRLGLAGAVLLAEYLVISLRFDALTVVERGGIWTWVGRVGTIAPLAVVVVTTLLLLRKGTSPWSGLGLTKPKPIFLGLHAVFYAALYAVTTRVFGSEAAPPGSPALWLGLFAVIGLGTGLSLLIGVAGPEIVLRAASWSMLVGVGIGLLGWIAGLFATELWNALSALTLSVVEGMLRPFVTGLSVDQATRTLELDGFEVLVSRECSGLEGVGLIAVLLAAYLIAFRDRLRMPSALLLLPLGVLAVWFGNAVRIAVLMVIGATVDADLAYGGFHSKLGWVLFCAVTLGVAALGHHSRFFSLEHEAKDEPYENPAAGFLMPALVLNATALVTAMLARDVDRLYWLRLVAAGAVLVALRRYYRDLARSGSVFAVAVGLAVGAVWVLTARGGGEAAAVEVDWFWLATRTVGSVLVVPLVEELAFRGCLLRWLQSRDFTTVPFTKWTPWAVAGSSLCFGVLHERWIEATVVGVVYAALQIRRGQIGDAILAHAATNAAVSATALWTGNLSYWS